MRLRRRVRGPGNKCATIVCMANTKHVTVRLHSDIVSEIDKYAEKVKRSRSYLIEACLQEIYGNDDVRAARGGETVSPIGSGHNASVPVLPQAKSPAKRLRTVQPLRNELASRRGSESRSESEPHKGHNTFRNGTVMFCADCKTEFER